MPNLPPHRPPLRYDVFVAPEKPFVAPEPHVGDPPAWDPAVSPANAEFPHARLPKRTLYNPDLGHFLWREGSDQCALLDIS
jgi:hypothetical protein